MALYTREELESFADGFRQPAPVEPTRGLDPAHDRMLGGRAYLDKLWQQERAAYRERQRVPEAICRGYNSGMVVTPALTPQTPRQFFMPGDDKQATRGWVRYHLAGIEGLEHAHASIELKDGYLRETWRAAAAAMIVRDRQAIKEVHGYLLACLNHLASGQTEDVRYRPGFVPGAGWAQALIEFVGLK